MTPEYLVNIPSGKEKELVDFVRSVNGSVVYAEEGKDPFVALGEKAGKVFSSLPPETSFRDLYNWKEGHDSWSQFMDHLDWNDRYLLKRTFAALFRDQEKRFLSLEDGPKIASARYQDLLQVKGVGEKAATVLKAAFSE